MRHVSPGRSGIPITRTSWSEELTMARGRMINRKVATSEKVAAYGDEYGPWALVFHHRLIAFLDVNGCCRADPYWLKAEIFPRVSGITPEDCRRFAAGLVKHGLAVLYEVAGMPYLHMPGFREEQVGLRVDRESPEVPVPEGFDPSSGKFPANFRKPSGYCPEVFPPEIEVEVEVEVEGEDITGAKAPEAAPRSEDARANGRGDPRASRPIVRKAGAAAFAPVIREHLWLGDEPPRVSGSESCDMGRDLSIAYGFLQRKECALDELAGAITVARRTLGLDRDRPLTMRIFQVAGRRDRLHECISAWRKAERASGDR